MEALAQGEMLESICKSRKNKDYVALDNPSAHVSRHQARKDPLTLIFYYMQPLHPFQHCSILVSVSNV